MLKFAILASCRPGVCYANHTKAGFLTKTGENSNWRMSQAMKMKKQVVSLLLAIFLVVCANVVTALAYDAETIQGGIKYGLSYYDGTATVVGPDGECEGEVRIPSVVEYNGDPYVVTAIGEGAFRGCSGLTSIKLPDTLRSIGDSAFYGCYSLSSITIPRGVQSIGDDAFNGCLGLRTVCFLQRSDLKHIGFGAFYDCSNLSNMELPASVRSMQHTFFGSSETNCF